MQRKLIKEETIEDKIKKQNKMFKGKANKYMILL